MLTEIFQEAYAYNHALFIFLAAIGVSVIVYIGEQAIISLHSNGLSIFGVLFDCIRYILLVACCLLKAIGIQFWRMILKVAEFKNKLAPLPTWRV